jgi:hypothetical protein
MDKDKRDDAPAPQAPDALNASEHERRAARPGRDGAGRPLNAEETAPGERGDGPYGDSEPGGPRHGPPDPPARA